MDFSAIAAELGATQPIEVPALSTHKGRTLFVDGDMLCYYCAGNDYTTVAAARSHARNLLTKMQRACGAERTIIGMTGSWSTKGDRSLVAVTKPYQGTRSGHKPKNWQHLRDWLVAADNAIVVYDREADDQAALLAAQANSVDDIVLCSRDKDFRMIPALHLNWMTMELVRVPRGCYSLTAGDEVFGYKWFLLQMLHGDTVDGIPGLPSHPSFRRGVGAVAANTILHLAQNATAGILAVVEAYKTAYPDTWASLFVEQATLLWMRQDTDASLDDWYHHLPLGVDTEDYAALANALEEQRRRVTELKEEADVINKAASLQD